MKIVENYFKVNLGGNYYINCDCLIAYKDEPLFILKRGESGLLLISFYIYSKNGDKIAIVKNNNIYSSHKDSTDNYKILEEMDRVRIVEIKSGNTLCDIRKRKAVNNSPESMNIELEVYLKTYLQDGELLDITPEGTNYDTHSIKGNTFTDLKIAMNLKATLSSEDILKRT
jgi:hypothetical protein